MEAFCPLFSGVGGWSIGVESCVTTPYYSQNHPLLYLNNAHDDLMQDDYSFNYLAYNGEEENNNFNAAPMTPPLIIGSAFTTETAAAMEDKRKLNHNASERDRRKKINSMYSSLRSVLPPTNTTKRVSNPDSVARALKYIPELQKKVELLSQKKHQMMLPTSHSSQVEAMGNGEILLQISTLKNAVASSIPISEVIKAVEELDIIVTGVSFSQSSTGTTLTHLFLKVEENQEIDSELLKRIQGLKFSYVGMRC